MVLAPPKLATAVLVCRCIAVGLEATALSYTMSMARLSFSTLIFLKTVLFVHLSLSVMRLLYDVAQVFMHEPLPANGWLMATLVAAEWVMLHMLFVAGVSSAAVVDALYRVLRKCPLLPPGFCYQYRAAVVLTMLAWFFSVPIAFLMFYLGAYWNLAAADAAEAAAAAEAADHQA